MEKAIRVAIENGWNGLEFKDKIEFDKAHMVIVGESNYTEKHILEVSTICLDPLFWQALGKGLGWEKDKWYPFSYSHSHIGEYMDEWKWMRLCFIRHLSEGKDINSFFDELTKDNH